MARENLKVDVTKTIQRLIKKGYSLESIADNLKKSYPTIWRWSVGKGKAHKTFAEKLEALLKN